MWVANPQHAYAWQVERKPCHPTTRRRKARSLTCQASEHLHPFKGQHMTDVDVILVSPKSPANVGSVARAAENFELACGSSLMDNVNIVSSLEEAVSASTASIGFTRRQGNTRLVHASLHHLLQSFPHLLPSHAISQTSNSMDKANPSSGMQDSKDLMSDSESSSSFDVGSSSSSTSSNNSSSITDSISSSCSQQIGSSRSSDSNAESNSSKSADNRSSTALVFGREESGLTEAELSLCTHSCSIPTGSVQPSLNLSHAVCVVLAQIFQHRTLGNTGLPTSTLPTMRKHHQPASNADMTVLLQRWTDLAAAAGLGLEESVGGTGSHGRKRRTAGHIKAVLSRAQVTQQELRALHKLCSALLTKVDEDRC